MTLLSSPQSFERANPGFSLFSLVDGSNNAASGGGPHPSIPHLALLVFEAVLEVVCVSLPGYIIAWMGMFDAESQKFVANLNVMLFTPCLIFTKLASQLTAGKLADLAIIPVLFVIQTLISYLSAMIVSRCFGFKKRQSNFVKAMGVFGNSNSLPISLVISLSKTLSGLHWDKIPGDNDSEVAARGILYLLIFQQLGQAVRWSWGYHVLLAPRESYLRDEEETANARLAFDDDSERYLDNPDTDPARTAVNSGQATPARSTYSDSSSEDSHFESGDQTPVLERHRPYAKFPSSNGEGDENTDHPVLILPNGEFAARPDFDDDIAHFPRVQEQTTAKSAFHSALRSISKSVRSTSQQLFNSLPLPLQKFLGWAYSRAASFFSGLWAFMNPPLWAMLVAVLVASIPSVQRVFFTPGNFLSNSVTRAVKQSGGVAVPLILVVLGANLERSTLPKDALADEEDPKEERKLIIASLVARMVLPTLIMGPILAVTAKYVPVSILNDPIFIVVCFLLVGAPSALQLAQICQINNVYMGAMSRILFHSYVIWILPSTLILVISALQVVQWAAN
ncbi:auxin Efflux Carrier superfamily protein [Arthroderma uncinatum]|uniref:auxin Efflux Carrier superfamily protein n=1 Tax=Arthroderma uncinatum TaxID=74035 RepID=UPI00144A9ECB|nr:auxin Efflux Carrier superfamily protein [Arthroderma uncinatum]KAF3481153.1 auxin Efflux Carrier superfamily protein [Arthroderma uncinatum]